MAEIDFTEKKPHRGNFIESKTILGFAVMDFQIVAETDNEDDRLYTGLTINNGGPEITVDGIPTTDAVSLGFTGASERRQLIEGLRWMADRLEAI